MKRSRYPVALCIVLAASSLITPSLRANPNVSEDVRQVADYLLGTMESTLPARDGQAEVARVRMTTCTMQLVDAGRSPEPSLYLYQEQAMVTAPDRPYRQRVLKLSQTPDGEAVESFGFRLVDDESWAGLCDRPTSDRVMTAGDLGEATCGLRLEPEGDEYWGSTPEGGCPSQYQGASYTTNTVHLTETTMETWDRGFDAEGNQVWGAGEEGYEFVDISP